MSDIFGGIFDSLGDTVSSLFDGSASISQYANVAKLGVGLGGALLGSSGANSTQADSSVLRGLRITGALDMNTQNPLSRVKNDSPIHTKDSFDAAQSVDPMTLERQWDDRLATYADITRATSVQGGR